MSIPLPNLDDRTYAELTAEARALIPSLLPTWTNHNPSDPGIVLMELLAWLTEMLLFQVNEIPAANTEKFLKLLNGPTWMRSPDLNLEGAIRQTMRDLRERYRAITSDDYEYLALQTWPLSDAAQKLDNFGQIRRVRCVPQRNLAALDAAEQAAPAPGHVSLAIIPEPAANDDYPVPSDALRAALYNFLDARRALTVRQHVVGPNYVPVTIGASLALHEDALTAVAAAAALAQAREALAAFFHPLHGGPAQAGWPFGRAVYVSEVYAVLEQVPLVNYIEDVTLTGSRSLTDDAGQVVGLWLDAHELVKLQPPALVAYDVYGNQYQ